MKKRNLIILTILVIIGLIFSIYLMLSPLFNAPSPDEPIIVGNDTDSHGCIGSAGYQWCETKQKCLRSWEEVCNPDECKNFTADKCPTGCLVCPPCAACSSISCNSKEFCNSIGFNDTWYNSTKPPIETNSSKIYCTPEQKKSQVCPEYYSATCGWFNESIKCLKYPCANTFSNPCFACADPSVEYYTIGECPK